MKNMKILLTGILFITFINADLVVFAINAHGEGTENSQKQTVCPVMGGKVNPTYYADVQGKRIYVCCPGCIETIKNNPEKYISQIEEQGIVLENRPEN